MGQKLPSSYTEPAIKIDEARRSWVEFCRRSPFFRGSTIDTEYDQVDSFLPAFDVLQSHPADVFLSNELGLFLREMR